jgi:hypothetical protein
MFRVAMVAAVALLLAGCATPPAADPTPVAVAAEVAPQTLDWRHADCESVAWSVPVLASRLQPHLPAGFEPSATEPPAGAAPPLPGALPAATLGFRAVECTEGFGQADILRSVQSGSLFTPVIPPAELRDDRFTGHVAFGWDVLVASDSWRRAASGWGLPVHDGGSMVGPTAQGWTGALAMDRVGTFTLTGRTVDNEQPRAGHEVRTITAGRDGFALWDGAVESLSVSTGVGVWSVSPGSWVEGVLGATQGVATFERATWSMPSGTVHWPGQTLGPLEEDSQATDGALPPLPPLTPSLGRAIPSPSWAAAATVK